MAEKLKIENWRAKTSDGKYPWNKWLDGDVWRIFWGEDYHCSDRSMRSNIQKMVHKRGLKVTIEAKVPGQMTFRAFPPEQKPVSDEVGKLREKKRKVS